MNPHQSVAKLLHRLASLRFAHPVTHVYNPLEYAAVPHAHYLDRFARGPIEVLLVGMNPGPWGMVQTGVPFGAIPAVRDWLGITGPVGRPDREHPRRPVQGFACRRTEVSGQRLWGWAQASHGTPARFFARFFVHNYCPLAFMEESGRNRTPDKLPITERQALYAACDAHLLEMTAFLQPRCVVGIGAFADARARQALQRVKVRHGHILHPSPASPLANAGWAPRATAQLAELDVAIRAETGG